MLLQVAWIKQHINTANVSSTCILLLVWITFCNTFASGATKQVHGRDVAATVFLNVALFVLFVTLSFILAWPPPPVQFLRKMLRLKKPDVVAVVICGSTKTVALGVPLINVMYKQVPYAGVLAMPLIIYHALQVLLGGVMLGTLKKWCLKTDVPAAPASSNRQCILGQVSHEHVTDKQQCDILLDEEVAAAAAVVPGDGASLGPDRPAAATSGDGTGRVSPALAVPKQ